MSRAIVESQDGVTLIGGAPVGRAGLRLALGHAPRLVAADSGADRALALGYEPEAVIGDLDSISPAARARLAGRLHHLPEQETTDFDKALRSITAPFIIGLGFSGARLDHGLAVLNTLVRHPAQRCIILSGQDIVFLAPAALTLNLPPGARLSLFPMAPVTGRSEGLRWPLDGIGFAPDGMTGTSNMVGAPCVRLWFDQPRMLVIMGRRHLPAALAGLRQSARGG